MLKFFKRNFKTLKIDIWHLNLPHGRICVVEIDGLDLLLVGFHQKNLLTLGHMAPLGLLKKMAKINFHEY